MKKQKKKQSGITLIALVISIIVMLILAGVSLNAMVGENGILSQARKSNVSQRLAQYIEELTINKADDEIQAWRTNLQENETELYAVGDEVKKYIPNLRDDDLGKIAIFANQLVYTGKDLSSEDLMIANELGILNMSEDDYEYMLGMYYIEQAVKHHSSDTVKIGTELGTVANPYVTIAGINYGLGWYKINEDSEFDALGLTEEEKNLIIGKSYSDTGYIVKYNSGAVQSIAGKNMYAGLSNEIWKYTFNYTGEYGGLIVENLLTGVTKDSTKTATQFGELVPAKTYARSGITSGVIENYYKDDYTYDSDGGIILTKTTNILHMPIDQTKPINQKMSINITIKCDIATQNAFPTNSADDLSAGGCVVALSDEDGKYILRLEINHNIMRIYSYLANNYDLTARTDVDFDGEKVIDVSQYDNKYLNIQLTSERDGKTKVYFNGTKVTDYNSGGANLTYNYCTIGDIRPGRGAKYVGNVYNFALYGDILTDEQIAQNWNYVKNELGINDAGDKVN